MNKVGEAYIYMVDIMEESTGELTLGEAADAAADHYDLTLSQEHEIIRLYIREHQ